MSNWRTNMSNQQIKIALKNNGIAYWQVADELCIAENTFGRWMRTDLSQDKYNKVVDAIKAIITKRLNVEL